MSESKPEKPHRSFSITSFSYSIFDEIGAESLYIEHFDTLPVDIYSYFRESGDTIPMGILSYDTTLHRLRMDMISNEEGEYVGVLMKEVSLLAERYYRLTAYTEQHGMMTTGIMGLSAGDSESEIREMKPFAPSSKSSQLLYSGAGGDQTLLLAYLSDDSTSWYYVDSLRLELLDISDSVLYGSDFGVPDSSGWRTVFGDSSTVTAGVVEWNSIGAELELHSYEEDAGRYFGAAVREIRVVPGLYHTVRARVHLPDTVSSEVSLGVYEQSERGLELSALSAVPYSYMHAKGVYDTVLSFSFVPDRNNLSLVLMYKGSGAALQLDDVEVYSIDGYSRDTLHTEPFDDSTSVSLNWRSSFWPDSVYATDSLLLSYLSHDTTGGRMRVELADDFNGSGMIGGAVRRLTGLKVGKLYELSIELEAGELNDIDTVEVMFFRSSLISEGLLIPAEEFGISGALLSGEHVFRFTASEPEMIFVLNGAKAADMTPTDYYIHGFSLREGTIKTLDCSRSNLQYADRDRYRFGFNGQERQPELGSSYTTAEYWMYDGRLGRRWEIDPVVKGYISPYATLGNNPIFYNDVNGDDWEVEKTENKDGTTNYNVTVNAALLNHSGDNNLDVEALQNSIKKQIESVYNTEDNGVTINTKLNIRLVNSINEVKDSEHLIAVMGDKEYDDLGFSNAKGAGDLGGLKIVIPNRTALETIAGNNNRTIAHELGHTGGLYHPEKGIIQGVNTYDKNDGNNLMYPSSITSGTALKSAQIHTIYQNYVKGRINQKTQFTHRIRLVHQLSSPLSGTMIYPTRTKEMSTKFRNWVSWTDRILGP